MHKHVSCTLSRLSSSESVAIVRMSDCLHVRSRGKPEDICSDRVPAFPRILRRVFSITVFAVLRLHRFLSQISHDTVPKLYSAGFSKLCLMMLGELVRTENVGALGPVRVDTCGATYLCL